MRSMVAVAWVTGIEGGARLVEVVEVDGILVELATGIEIDLVDLVRVDGLPELSVSVPAA